MTPATPRCLPPPLACPPAPWFYRGRLADDAVPELYRAAAAVVLPSCAEGFGLPVLEAMACGVPIICSDIPVLREIAEGVAIFCDPADPASFAEGMLTALGRKPGRRGGEAGSGPSRGIQLAQGGGANGRDIRTRPCRVSQQSLAYGVIAATLG